MIHIRKCPKCNIYVLDEKCPICGERTIRPIPPKFSPEDKYGKYRRIIKRKILEEKGWL